MGFVQENRNLKVGPQPASLFEVPAGFAKTAAPGMPAGVAPRAAAGAAATAAAAQLTSRDGRKTTQAAVKTVSSAGLAWKRNTNYPGGDYRSIDMATSDPTACKAACDSDAPCKAWTLVTPTEPGGMGYCWLKDSIPQEISEDCCISGLKGASGGSRASQHQFEMNVNRVGEDYRDYAPAKDDPALCAQACAKESRCRAWTWVKNKHEPPTGHCWLKEAVPDPGQDDCCVSGVKP